MTGAGLCFVFTLAADLLSQQAAIPMAGVKGRIDHLAVDTAGQRIFVAGLGNDSVEVIDLKQAKRTHSIPGLAEPQGLAFLPGVNRLFVANGKDGSVRIFDGSTFQQTGTIPFGDDADNLRIDPSGARIWAGYGSGAVGEFDPDGHKLVEIRLDAHPESFQLEHSGPRLFVNLPRSRKVGVVDRTTGKVVASWGTGGPLANYAMALDESNRRLFVVSRLPARLIVLDLATGTRVASAATAGDCDDVFYDAKRRRLYLISGSGWIVIIDQRTPDQYAEVGRIPIPRGSRTGVLSPDLDRLFVAVRQSGSQGAELRVYAPR